LEDLSVGVLRRNRHANVRNWQSAYVHGARRLSRGVVTRRDGVQISDVGSEIWNVSTLRPGRSGVME